MKTQPESAVHAPFTKRQPYQAASSTSSMLDVFLQEKGLPPSSSVSSSSSLPQQTTSSPHVVPPPASSLQKMAAVPSLGQQVSSSSSDVQGSSPLPLQQHKLKQQKKRTSITTKVKFKQKLQYLKHAFLKLSESPKCVCWLLISVSGTDVFGTSSKEKIHLVRSALFYDDMQSILTWLVLLFMLWWYQSNTAHFIDLMSCTCKQTFDPWTLV